MNKIFRLLAILFLTSAIPAGFAAPLEKPYDHSPWDAFLKKFVNEKGEVNFAAVKKDPELLKAYLHQLRKVRQFDFLQWPREEKIALWINAYHAAAVKTAVRHYPVKSLQEIPSAWETKLLKVGKSQYSLNQIRSEQLIEQFHDEKIHFALSCMAKSCPQLSRDAYTGPKLEGQLYEAVRKFINDPQKNSIDPEKKKVQVSKMFKWYGPDFRFNFGKPDNEKGLSKEEFSFLSFISYYLDDSAQGTFLQEGRYKIRYLPFDWSLNDWHS